MRKLMVMAGAAVLLAATAVSGFAAEATGTVASVNEAAGTVTLDSGQTFKLASTIAVASLRLGEQVSVAYEEGDNGNVTATKISPAQQ